MKYIISIAIGVAVFFGSASLAHVIFHEKALTWIVGLTFGVLSMVISYKKIGDTSIKQSVADGISYVKATREEMISLIEDKDAELYAIAEQEIIDEVINNGLWSQALVKAKGDENLRKVEYMKLRVKQLKKKA